MVLFLFGWLSALFCLLACGVWIVRKCCCKNKKVLRWMRGKQHHNWGIYGLAAGTLHGVLALWMTKGGIMPTAIATGVLLLVPLLLLCTAVQQRKKWPRTNWLTVHRWMTLCFIVLLLLHLAAAD